MHFEAGFFLASIKLILGETFSCGKDGTIHKIIITACIIRATLYS